MKHEKTFLSTVCHLAVPVALQSMLQSSFSMVDQIMIGQLGSVQVASVGLAGKFSSIYSVLVSAVGAVAGIMIAQYLGQKNQAQVRRSFSLNLFLALGVAAFFTVLSAVFPKEIMSLYINDPSVVSASAGYLRILSGTFLPMAGATMLSAMFRCMELAQFPLYASIASAILNTILNYIFIFGKAGCPSMGAEGAALATLLSQFANLGIMLLLFRKYTGSISKSKNEAAVSPKVDWKQYFHILLPILVCELAWSLGENIYAIIYGHLGTDASAAMTLTNPIQGLMIGALCGLSQAASVIIGKKLGSHSYEEAYQDSKKLLLYGLVGSMLLSCLLLLISPLYVQIYQVEASVKAVTRQILFAYALVAPFKVLNMILGGGILRSGGKTTYVMVIDILGTWCFGVPLGLLAAFVLKLTIPYVYFLLSLEECIRFAISLVVLRRKNWMQSLNAEAS